MTKIETQISKLRKIEDRARKNDRKKWAIEKQWLAAMAPLQDTPEFKQDCRNRGLATSYPFKYICCFPCG